MSKTVHWISKIIFILIIGIPFVYKLIFISQFMFNHTETRYFGMVQVLANDAIIYIPVLILVYLSFLPKVHRIFSIILRSFAIFVLGIYIIDCLLILKFSTHITTGDVIKYTSYALKFLYQTYTFAIFPMILMLLISLPIVFSFILTKYSIKNNRVHHLSISLIIILIITSCFRSNSKYVHAYMYNNFVEYNLKIISESNAYSTEFISQFHWEDKRFCSPQRAEYPNIIILMVESLSSYQSQFFSGIRNWTPNIDAIAEKNIAFTNFYANGFITEDGEIALLTGRLPIYPPSSLSNDGCTSFKGFYHITSSLPHRLKKRGYWTEFITSADLEFSNTGEWANSIGFDYLEGHEHPDYINWERYHFKAAPDEALFKRVNARIAHNSPKRFFLFVKTTSTHFPFINPDNKNKSEAETVSYADKHIGQFYKALMKSGYFENGILIIVGDHHAMVPLKKEEIDQFGALKAAAKVPGIISYGNKTHLIITEQYQQVDIFNGLNNKVSSTQCYSDWMGDIFSYGQNPPKYIFHRRGDFRNIISVFLKDTDLLIKLDGDRTRMISAALPAPPIQKQLIQRVNAARISPMEIPASETNSH